MNKKHFLRNWALHYTDPSYLYLPMREKQKYKLIGQRYKVNGIFMPEEGYAINKAVVDVDHYMNGAPIYVTDLAQQLQDSTAPKLTLHFGNNNLYYCVIQLSYDWFPYMPYTYYYGRYSNLWSKTATHCFLWWSQFSILPSTFCSVYKTGETTPLFITQWWEWTNYNETLVLGRQDISVSDGTNQSRTMPRHEEELVSIDSISAETTLKYPQFVYTITKRYKDRNTSDYDNAAHDINYVSDPYGYISEVPYTEGTTQVTRRGVYSTGRDPISQRRVWCSVDEETFMYHRAMIQMELNDRTYYVESAQNSNTNVNSTTNTREVEFTQNGTYTSQDAKAWGKVKVNVPKGTPTVTYPLFDTDGFPHPAHYTKFSNMAVYTSNNSGNLYQLYLYRPNTLDPYGQFGTAMSPVTEGAAVPTLAIGGTISSPKYSYSTYYPRLCFLAVLVRGDNTSQQNYRPIVTYWLNVTNQSAWTTKATDASVGDRSLSGLIDNDHNTGIYSNEATLTGSFTKTGIGQAKYTVSAVYRWISHWYYYREDPANDYVNSSTTNQRSISNSFTNFYNWTDGILKLHVSPMEFAECLRELNERIYAHTFE